MTGALFETFYFTNKCFFTKSDELLEEAEKKLKEIPCFIVQARCDLVCPMRTAWELFKRLENVKMVVVVQGGHLAFGNSKIETALIQATEKFKEV